MLTQQHFIHHVYFWLADPTQDNHAALLEGLKGLSTVPVIKQFHIGVPANTNRDVIETSYDFSWLAVFDSAEDEAIYQSHPIHLHFIETCKHLWGKVLVYDSIGAP